MITGVYNSVLKEKNGKRSTINPEHFSTGCLKGEKMEFHRI